MIFEDLRKRKDVDPIKLQKAKRRVDDAKDALIFYDGEVLYKPKRDKNGRSIYDEFGRHIYTNEIAEQRIGLIQQLTGTAQKLKKQSNLGERFDERTFTTFNQSRDYEAYRQASYFAESEGLFKEKGNGRIFTGGTGTGKTHLAAAITNVLVGREIPVLFATYSEHLTKIKSQFNTPEDGTYLSQMKTTMMLVIDDLGAELDRDYSRKILYDVINYRYEHLLPLVITTNLTESGLLVQYGDRVYSRLIETCKIIKMNGADYRAGRQ